jgi:hypothetical protein
MKHAPLLSSLSKLLGLYLVVIAATSLLDVGSNVVMYWNLRARPYGSLWSLSSLAGPMLELSVGLFIFLQSRWLAHFLTRYDAPQCPACGYDRTGAHSPICSECGINVDLASMPSTTSTSSQKRFPAGWATASVESLNNRTNNWPDISPEIS